MTGTEMEGEKVKSRDFFVSKYKIYIKQIFHECMLDMRTRCIALSWLQSSHIRQA